MSSLDTVWDTPPKRTSDRGHGKGRVSGPPISVPTAKKIATASARICSRQISFTVRWPNSPRNTKRRTSLSMRASASRTAAPRRETATRSPQAATPKGRRRGRSSTCADRVKEWPEHERSQRVRDGKGGKNKTLSETPGTWYACRRFPSLVFQGSKSHQIARNSSFQNRITNRWRSK